MAEYEKKVREVLKKNGFIYTRHGKGSHDIWSNNNSSVSVPIKIKSRYTANEILKDAGIKHHF